MSGAMQLYMYMHSEVRIITLFGGRRVTNLKIMPESEIGQPTPYGRSLLSGVPPTLSYSHLVWVDLSIKMNQYDRDCIKF